MIDKLNITDAQILLVGNRKGNLLILEALLKKEGYKTNKALSGENALKKCLKNSYDLFVLDVQIPKVNGIELANNLKAVSRTRNIPVIFVTTLTQKRHIVKGWESGAVDYLIKPVDSELFKLKAKAFIHFHHEQLRLQFLKENLDNIVEKRTAKLKAKEKKYKAVVKQSLEAICMLNPKTKRIIEGNSAFCKYLGYSAKAIEKLSVYDITVSNKANVDFNIKQVLQTGSADVGERQWRKKNGDYITVLVSASTIRQGNDDIIVLTARDITSQKQIEKELQMRNHELDTFVYKASHDLRSPLASTLGLINLGRKEIKDKDGLKYLDLIHKSMYKLDEILEDLTQLTIIRQGKTETKPIKVTPFIANIVQAFERDPKFAGIDIRIKSKLKRPLNSDPRLLKTILRNITENAIKYRKHNSKSSYIYISVGSNHKEDIIRIADNGMGIRKTHQKNIFNMFFRATETSKGTGLGLYIVKNAVEKLRGRIEVISKEKTGTTFNLYLPKQ
ncbi:MAG TPA: response regulator [Flavobacteriales bacterium]|nr:response regulator [Flavobacteriales bacterium]